MDVHIGKRIKEVMYERRMSPGEFATKLGINPGGASRLFKRKEFHCTLLRRIGEILDYNFFHYYVPENNSDERLAERIKVLEGENTLLRNNNMYLKEINELLKEKK